MSNTKFFSKNHILYIYIINSKNSMEIRKEFSNFRIKSIRWRYIHFKNSNKKFLLKKVTIYIKHEAFSLTEAFSKFEYS